MNWETKEVINTLINDEGCYNVLRRSSPATIQRIVAVEKMAPPWLYKSFQAYNGNFNAVDWNKVAQSLR